VKIFRLHFHPGADRQSLHSGVVDLLMLLHEAGTWQKILHLTGESKREAIKKAFDPTRHDAIKLENLKITSECRWPNF
jgi:hypothetical protein